MRIILMIAMLLIPGVVWAMGECDICIKDSISSIAATSNASLLAKREEINALVRIAKALELIAEKMP